MKKRIVSFLLVLLYVVTLFPVLLVVQNVPAYAAAEYEVSFTPSVKWDGNDKYPIKVLLDDKTVGRIEDGKVRTLTKKKVSSGFHVLTICNADNDEVYEDFFINVKKDCSFSLNIEAHDDSFECKVKETVSRITTSSSSGSTKKTSNNSKPTSTPKPKPTPTPVPPAKTERKVWIPTNGGKKYHSNSGCSGMKNPIQVTISEAISRGFDACKKCKP